MARHVNLLSPEPHENSVLNAPVERSKANPSVRYAADWNDLVATAKNDDIELVLWKRSQLSSIGATEDAPKSEFEILIGEQQDILAGFTEAFKKSDWPTSLHEIVEQDVHAFLEAFEARLSGSQYRLRLQALSDDACRKFHQDRTFQRLIITYRGPGTVWRYMDSLVEHKAIEMECVLLRGKRTGQDTQILHKSPLFPSGHLPRLIMVIDVMPNNSPLTSI